MIKMSSMMRGMQGYVISLAANSASSSRTLLSLLRAAAVLARWLSASEELLLAMAPMLEVSTIS